MLNNIDNIPLLISLYCALYTFKYNFFFTQYYFMIMLGLPLFIIFIVYIYVNNCQVGLCFLKITWNSPLHFIFTQLLNICFKLIVKLGH